MKYTLDQIEAFICGQFKTMLAHEPETGLPTTTDWGESPDIVCTWSAKTAGIEFTISNHWIEMRAHEIATEDPRVRGRTTIRSGLLDGPTKQTKEAVYEIVVQKLLGCGPWDDMEKIASATVEKMLAAIAKKTVLLNKPHYRCFQENWLVVSEFIGSTVAQITAVWIWEKLLMRLPQPDYEQKNFDKIYLIYGDFAVVIERHKSKKEETMRWIVDSKLLEPIWEFRPQSAEPFREADPPGLTCAVSHPVSGREVSWLSPSLHRKSVIPHEAAPKLQGEPVKSLEDTAEQAALLDDLIVGSCDAAWEARLAPEMEARVDAVERGDMRLHEAAEIFGEMRTRLLP